MAHGGSNAEGSASLVPTGKLLPMPDIQNLPLVPIRRWGQPCSVYLDVARGAPLLKGMSCGKESRREAPKWQPAELFQDGGK